MEHKTDVSVSFSTIWIAYDDGVLELTDAFTEAADSLLYSGTIADARDRAGKQGLVRELTIDVPSSALVDAQIDDIGAVDELERSAVIIVLETVDQTDEMWTVGATNFDPEEDDIDDVRLRVQEIISRSDSETPTVHALPVTVQQVRAALATATLHVTS